MMKRAKNCEVSGLVFGTRLGDRVHVPVSRVDLDALKIQLSLVQKLLALTLVDLLVDAK
jgi:hypothetical protein